MPRDKPLNEMTLAELCTEVKKTDLEALIVLLNRMEGLVPNALEAAKIIDHIQTLLED